MNVLDRVINYFSPTAGLRRAHARRLIRSYSGAESNRLTAHKKPRNLSADQELLGPFGADSLRAWARDLVRNNAYAWNVVDTIVSNVIGDGITAQSTYETPEGEDIEDVNDARDKMWSEWCEVADINGQLTFSEIQVLCQREICEAGEVLVRIIKTPGKEYKGISRPVPLALELIEADRLSLDKDTYRAAPASNNKIIRGVEIDDKGKPVAYWIYPQHPSSPYMPKSQMPERVPASEILHLFRRERIGQTRGVTWFAPIASTLRDLGVYIDNELQGSAIASCFVAAIKTDTPVGSLLDPDGETTDENGNNLEYLEPGIVARLKPGEDITAINPARPNSSAEPWINLMLRGTAAGTGTNYEAIAKDFSSTSYSSSRTSKLEDRPRYKRWQNYIVWHLCQPVWDEFCNAAARIGDDNFPTSSELLEDRRRYAPVEWQRPEQEWVDPQSEQTASEMALNSFTDTYQNVLGSRGRSFRSVFYQRAKEERMRKKLGLITPEERQQQISAAQTQQATLSEPQAVESAPQSDGVDVASLALNGAQVTSLVDLITQVGTGAMPKETAVAVIKAAFPSLNDALVAEIVNPIVPGSIAADGVPQATTPQSEEQRAAGTGEMMGLSTLQFNRNRKAILKTIEDLASGSLSETQARVFLSSIGMNPDSVEALIKDASDGTVDNPLPAEST